MNLTNLWDDATNAMKTNFANCKEELLKIPSADFISADDSGRHELLKKQFLLRQDLRERIISAYMEIFIKEFPEIYFTTKRIREIDNTLLNFLAECPVMQSLESLNSLANRLGSKIRSQLHESNVVSIARLNLINLYLKYSNLAKLIAFIRETDSSSQAFQDLVGYISHLK